LELEYSQRYENTQGTVSEVIVGSNAFENVIKENLLRAEDEVLISSSELISRLHLEEAIKDLQLKGVRINAISFGLPSTYNGTFDRRSGELVGPGVNTQLLESVPSKYIMVDNKSVSLLLDSYEQETCVQIQSPALCRVLRESFIQKWEKNRALTQKHNKHMLNIDLSE
jgi:hypothetical protein